MRAQRLLPLWALIGLLSLNGCGEEGGTNPTPDSGSDEDAIRGLMAEQGAFFDGGDAVSDGQVGVRGTGGKSAAAGAPIESFYFVREIRERNVRRTVVIETPEGRPPIAHVSTTAHLSGIFHLFYDDPDNVYLPGVIDKRLQAIADHRATFVRVERPDGDRHRGWRLAELSGTEVVSNPTTKDIVSVEVISNSVHTTITDPLALVPMRELLTFAPGEEVTLQVQTGDETDYVFLHTGGLKFDFQPLGGGLFAGTWTVGERRGIRRVAVDVIDEDTLFDDVAPYDSAAWVLHYRVAGERGEDFEM